MTFLNQIQKEMNNASINASSMKRNIIISRTPSSALPKDIQTIIESYMDQQDIARLYITYTRNLRNSKYETQLDIFYSHIIDKHIKETIIFTLYNLDYFDSLSETLSLPDMQNPSYLNILFSQLYNPDVDQMQHTKREKTRKLIVLLLDKPILSLLSHTQIFKIIRITFKTLFDQISSTGLFDEWYELFNLVIENEILLDDVNLVFFTTLISRFVLDSSESYWHWRHDLHAMAFTYWRLAIKNYIAYWVDDNNDINNDKCKDSDSNGKDSGKDDSSKDSNKDGIDKKENEINNRNKTNNRNNNDVDKTLIEIYHVLDGNNTHGFEFNNKMLFEFTNIANNIPCIKRVLDNFQHSV